MNEEVLGQNQVSHESYYLKISKKLLQFGY